MPKFRSCDENLITCTAGHTSARKFWRLFDVDPVFICCPTCGALQDLEVMEVAQPEQVRAVPPGREVIHIHSLIAKVEAWQRGRAAQGFTGGCLPEVVKYLNEYASLLSAVDPEAVVSTAPTQIARMQGESDADFKARAAKLPPGNYTASGDDLKTLGFLPVKWA